VPIKGRAPISLIDGVPLYAGESMISFPGRPPLVRQADGTVVQRAPLQDEGPPAATAGPATTAPGPGRPPAGASTLASADGLSPHADLRRDADGFEAKRLDRLSSLVLGDQQHKMQVGYLGGDLPPGVKAREVRRSASSMYTRTDVSLGEHPVQAPRPAGVDRFQRELSSHPAWQARELKNLPLLMPGRAYHANDALSFKVFRTSPTFRAVALEIAQVLPDDLSVTPAQATLSPLAQLIVQALRARGMGPLPWGDRSTEQGVLEAWGDRMELALSHVLNHCGSQFVALDMDIVDKHGDVGREILKGLREAVANPRGLQQVLAAADLPMAPRDPDLPLTREEMAVLVQQDPAAIDALIASSSIPDTLEHVDAVAEMMPEGVYQDARVLYIQHELGTQKAKFQASIDKGGLDPHKCEIIGVPYSTNYVSEAAFKKMGFACHTPDVVDPNDVGAAVERAAVAAIKKMLDAAQPDEKLLIVDDGGKAAKALHTFFPDQAHRFRIVEQTTRGRTELDALPALKAPAIDVARSALKRHETPHIGEEVIGEAKRIAAWCGLDVLQDKAVGVVGFGVIGEGVAGAAAAEGAHVTVLDKDPDQVARAQAMGFNAILLPEGPPDAVDAAKRAALGDKALIIGATGHRSITREDIERFVSHETCIGSASSRDVEVEMSHNRDPDVETIPLVTAGPGDKRFVTRVWRTEDKDVVMLKNGFPLNFNGKVETGSAESIQQTRAIMMLAEIQALMTDPGDVKVHPLDRRIQRAFAEKVGADIPPDLADTSLDGEPSAYWRWYERQVLGAAT
jgi:S-adenosylhomocysteine hydrolase